MEGIILALIQQLNASVFTLIAILLVLFWVVFKSGGWVASYKDFENKNEKFEQKIDAIKESIFRVQATTDLLYQTHLSTVQAHSPISLTQKGKDIASAISAEQKIDAHWERIQAEIELQNPVNPYDIQTVCLDIARNCFEKILALDEQNTIKSYAYSIGINLLEIYPILGVIMRDRYFREKNINPEDVDRHSPAIAKTA